MSEEVHPVTQDLALLLNDIRNGAVKGRPRELAAQIIDMVFKAEAERWAGSQVVYEGGDEGVFGTVKQNGSNIEGSHHRKVLLFYGEWEEGSPRKKNADPLTGEVPNPNRRQGPPPESPAQKASDVFKRMTKTIQNSTSRDLREFTTKASNATEAARAAGGRVNIQYVNTIQDLARETLEREYLSDQTRRDSRG